MSTLSILKFRTRLFAAVLAITPLSAALHAQDVGMLASVNVPFAFETPPMRQRSAHPLPQRIPSDDLWPVR